MKKETWLIDYDKLELIRRMRGITRNELAEKIGVPFNTLTGAINRKSQHSIINTTKIINLITQHLDVTFNDILFVENAEYINGRSDIEKKQLENELASRLNLIDKARNGVPMTEIMADAAEQDIMEEIVKGLLRLNNEGKKRLLETLKDLLCVPRYRAKIYTDQIIKGENMEDE